MPRTTVAQAVVAWLANQYIERDGERTRFFEGVFGIFGHGNVAGMGEALEAARNDVRYYQARNEQGMVHTAAAFAKQSRRLRTFACTTTRRLPFSRLIWFGPSAIVRAATFESGAYNPVDLPAFSS